MNKTNVEPKKKMKRKQKLVYFVSALFYFNKEERFSLFFFNFFVYVYFLFEFNILFNKQASVLKFALTMNNFENEM